MSGSRPLMESGISENMAWRKNIFRSPLNHRFLSFFVIVILRSMHLLTYRLQGLVTLRSDAIAMFMPTFICNGYVFLYFSIFYHALVLQNLCAEILDTID